MSVYTAQPPQQLGQQIPQPYAQQLQQPQLSQFFGQQPLQQFAYPGFPQQQFVPQTQMWQGIQMPQTVTELALRCAASAVSAVVDHLRMDPQALISIQTQGQIPGLTWGNVLVESTRRITPLLHASCAGIAQAQFAGQIQPRGILPHPQMAGQFGGMPVPQPTYHPQYVVGI
jgi:hypothetical protein